MSISSDNVFSLSNVFVRERRKHHVEIYIRKDRANKKGRLGKEFPFVGKNVLLFVKWNN